jgi:hypothetical protein
VLVVALASAAAVAAIALPELNRVTSTTTAPVKLPTGCVKPSDGFLIIASELGYNDSVDHGVPQNSWPVVNVQQGQNVTIVVCNIDPGEAHGFQIDNYYNARTVSIAPGQVLTVSFVANKAGTFRIYCNIFCAVHWAMQSGELVVA